MTPQAYVGTATRLCVLISGDVHPVHVLLCMLALSFTGMIMIMTYNAFSAWPPTWLAHEELHQSSEGLMQESWQRRHCLAAIWQGPRGWPSQGHPAT